MKLQDNYYINIETHKIIEKIEKDKGYIRSLSLEEKKEIFNKLNISLLNKEIKLQEIKNKIFYEKIKIEKDSNAILEKIPSDIKIQFLEYLNNKN